jgi:glutathione S-transferase
MAEKYPILYSFRRCPYAVRARLGLRVSDQIYELREVALSNKPPEMLAISPKGTVPVFIDVDGRVIDESIDIMLWALGKNDPEKWLMPEQGNLDAMLELIAEFDRGFKYNLDRYKYPNRYQDIDPEIHRTECCLYLNKLHTKLMITSYLFGNHITLADMAIAPFVRQFAHTDQEWFNKQPWLPLKTWLETLINSEIYVEVMAKKSGLINNNE